jgi:MOSC domain-containing protein
VISIAGLYVYPIKSCRGTALQRATLTRAGLLHDREWMVVTPEGRFLTQRDTPALARVTPVLRDGALVVSTPGASDLDLALDDRSGPTVDVTVWGDKCRGVDAGDEAARWFAECLGRPVRLVRFDPASRRATDPEWSDGLDGETRFTDGFPLLVLSQASLDDLNARLPAPLPVDRFRTSLLLEGCAPYEEDRIGTLAHDGVRLRLVKPCTRCIITTTDQSTGERDGEEPLRTLRTYRWNPQLRGVAFAQNAIVEAGYGTTLEVGMGLEPSYRT